MGMLATFVDSVALGWALENDGVRARVVASIRLEPVGRKCSRGVGVFGRAEVVVVGGGLDPFSLIGGRR